MIASVFLCLCALATDLPELKLTSGHTVISSSCRVVIAAGTVIADPDGQGVIQIGADDIELVFEPGSVMCGSGDLHQLERLSGTAIRVNGHKNIRIRGATIRGYKLGVWASNADNLELADSSFESMRARRLQSTPEAEDASDWLYPHHNDERPWREEYGGAVVVESSEGVGIHSVRVRHGQNGIILDRASNAKIYDNDCSFLSGWGLALWRTSDCTVSRNAFDFCIRGYSHGIYNRGQDSAGILIFEQSSRNLFVENSVTHGGDGVFGFAGREAIGEISRPGLDHSGLGCNDNIFVGNDLSFAAAHGLEMTFSHRNIIARNRVISNAICGIWGGYSQETQIVENDFAENGSAGYGLERGAINIEHGSGNQIISNRFVKNACGIHLWWDDDGKLLQLPGIKATDKGVSNNTIAANTSVEDEIFLRVRDIKDAPHVHDLRVASNSVARPGHDDEVAAGIEVQPLGTIPLARAPEFRGIGDTHPVGARRELAGRQNIVMGEYGPWDHATPLVQIRPVGQTLRAEVLPPPGGIGAAEPTLNVEGDVSATKLTGTSVGFTVKPTAPDRLVPCKVSLSLGDAIQTREALLLDTTWNVAFFPWTEATDPRLHAEEWRALATSEQAVTTHLSELSLKFGSRGPRELALNDELTRRGPGRDHFGVHATSHIVMPAGRWRIVTTSDDGIRVRANGKLVIDNWTWHGPTRDVADLSFTEETGVDFEVDYFEIDGFAVLDFQFEKGT